MKAFRDRNKKKNAWAEVARQAGLSTGIWSELIQCSSIVASIFLDVFYHMRHISYCFCLFYLEHYGKRGNETEKRKLLIS